MSSQDRTMGAVFLLGLGSWALSSFGFSLLMAGLAGIVVVALVAWLALRA